MIFVRSLKQVYFKLMTFNLALSLKKLFLVELLMV